MAKLVILDLEGNGRTEAVRVKVAIGSVETLLAVEMRGHLPANPELMEKLAEWRDRSQRLGQTIRAIKPQAILYDGSVNPKLEEYRCAANCLQERFQDWLTATGFQAIDKRLREEFNRHDPIQVLIRTQPRDFQYLPWHTWSFIDRYGGAEVTLGSFSLSRTPETMSPKTNSKVRILAILGQSAGIDTVQDRQLLESLPESDVTFLVEPNRQQLSQHLWDRPWDILFFAGHSATRDDSGLLALNPTESLSLEELKYGLRTAIAQGLQLAIFNSCDGLGLAYAIEEVGLPYLLVMREPVPDIVAVAFLKGFLQAFSQGRSLFAATREARERLEGLEGQFPCASWLPTIYQNTVQTSITWRSLKRPSPERKTHLQLLASLLIACAVACLVIVTRTLGLLETFELKAYDYLMASRPPIIHTDDRFVAVLIDENDIQYQIERGIKGKGSLSDDVLLQLLNKIDPHQPRIIGLDIIHDFPFKPEAEAYIQAHNNFFAICQVAFPTSGLAGIEPPPNIPIEQVGFANFPADVDRVVRRQLLGMSPDQSCPTDQSFSFRIATQYLNREFSDSVEYKRYQNDSLLIKTPKYDIEFKKFQSNSGGYHLSLDEAQGYQTLVNYRSNRIPGYSLRDILSFSEAQLDRLFTDKIVMIGVNRENTDRHRTPLNVGSQSTISGVLVHSQMTSNILAATLDQIPTISWFPETLENLWIGAVSIAGGLVLICAKNQSVLKEIALLSLILIVFGIGFYGMVQNIWLPLVPALISLIAMYVILIRTDGLSRFQNIFERVLKR